MVYHARNHILTDGSFFKFQLFCREGRGIFRQVEAKKLYLDLLKKHQEVYALNFYSYCFLDNQALLTGRLQKVQQFSDFFRLIHSIFSRTFRRRFKLKPPNLFERYKSSLIKSTSHLQKVMALGDLLPVNEGLVLDPQDYPFSSHRFYAVGGQDPLVTVPEFYLHWGPEPQACQRKYRELVAQFREKQVPQRKNSLSSD
jgi:putative transposase